MEALAFILVLAGFGGFVYGMLRPAQALPRQFGRPTRVKVGLLYWGVAALGAGILGSTLPPVEETEPAPSPVVAAEPSGPPAAEVPTLLSFTVLDSALTARPGKTQYSERLVLDAPADSAALRALLESRLTFARRHSSEWHASPTVISSYVFSPDADPTGADWLAMVLVTPTDAAPSYSFNREAIAYGLAPPGDRFGMTLAERERLFRDLVAAEQRARCEAEVESPLESASGEVTLERMQANVRLQDRLRERYEAALLRERSVTPDLADSVSIEGLTAQWPMPDAPCD